MIRGYTQEITTETAPIKKTVKNVVENSEVQHKVNILAWK